MSDEEKSNLTEPNVDAAKEAIDEARDALARASNALGEENANSVDSHLKSVQKRR